ncbi:hypothetical protein [Bartonella sp. B30(2025)]
MSQSVMMGILNVTTVFSYAWIFFCVLQYRKEIKILRKGIEEKRELLEKLVTILKHHTDWLEEISWKIEQFKPRFFLTSPEFKLRPGVAIPLHHLDMEDQSYKEFLRNIATGETP